jgi:hypothetical protein
MIGLEGLPLFSRAVSAPKAESSEARRRVAFERFHAENPHIYFRLRDLALEAKAAGKRVGIRLCWEKLRWDLTVTTKRGADAPKLNDWFPPYYSRLLMEQEPELHDFFEVRGGP